MVKAGGTRIGGINPHRVVRKIPKWDFHKGSRFKSLLLAGPFVDLCRRHNPKYFSRDISISMFE